MALVVLAQLESLRSKKNDFFFKEIEGSSGGTRKPASGDTYFDSTCPLSILHTRGISLGIP